MVFSQSYYFKIYQILLLNIVHITISARNHFIRTIACFPPQMEIMLFNLADK